MRRAVGAVNVPIYSSRCEIQNIVKIFQVSLWCLYIKLVVLLYSPMKEAEQTLIGKLVVDGSDTSFPKTQQKENSSDNALHSSFPMQPSPEIPQQEMQSDRQIRELIAIADRMDGQQSTGKSEVNDIFRESSSDASGSHSNRLDSSVAQSHSETEFNVLNLEEVNIALATNGVVLKGVLPPVSTGSLKCPTHARDNSLDWGSTQPTSQLSCSDRMLESWDNATLSESDLSKIDDTHPSTPIAPPAEVVAIREDNIAVEGPRSEETMTARMKDMEKLIATYRNKLEKADDLIESLFRDLEKSRRSMHHLSKRNAALTSEKKAMRTNMVDRSFLLKTCLYICPVFILCGCIEAFLSTVVMVWVFLELQLVDGKQIDDGEDGEYYDDGGTSVKVRKRVHKRRRRKITRVLDPIPTHIELPQPSPGMPRQQQSEASL